MTYPSKKKNRKKSEKLPIFDPNPSGRFVHEVFSKTDVNGILIGRLSVWVWISEEKKQAFTKDMDIAVTREGLHKIRKWLNDQQMKFLELEIGGVNVALPGHINVDFITRDGEFGDFSPLFEAAIENAVELGETIEVGGDKLVVVSPEYLTAMKIGTGEKKDEDDAEILLANTEIDVNHTRSIVSTFLGPGSLSRLEVILRKIGHPKAKPTYTKS